MNITQLLQNTLQAYKASTQLTAIEQHLKEVEGSTVKLKEEMQALLPQQAHFPETLGIISSVLENIESEIAGLAGKHKEIEISLLTEHFIAPIMEYLNKALNHPTRVQIHSSKDDVEIQIDIIHPEGVQSLSLVPDFAEGRVLFVANEELCNLSPLGSLKNSFGHELLIAPNDLSVLLHLLNIR